VFVVEGEKSAEACQKIMGDACVVTTWAHGAQSARKTDWASLAGRKVLIWPDADEVGFSAAKQIAGMLSQVCQDIRILNPSDKNGGWDAADALEEGMDYEKFKVWAEPRLEVYDPKADEDLDEKPTLSLNALWEEYGIARNGRGIPIPNLDNGLRILEKDPSLKGKIWWDEFHKKTFCMLDSDSPKEWSDAETLLMVADFQRRLGISKFSKEMAEQAVYVYAHQNIRNEPKDWMDTLVWDGEDRLTRFFQTYFGSKEGVYYDALGKNFWLSMVARIYNPGSKVDNMVVLQGEQGTFKTMALGIIGGSWYVSLTKSVESDDFYEAFQGKMIAEIAELEAFSRAETTKIKSMLTTQSDRYRRKYGRHAEEHPRQCVFVGTTNDDHFLRDTTGARRFWPVRITLIDIPKLREDRSQLFAEAVHRLNAGETWYQMPKEETEREQEDRRVFDEWEGPIQLYCKNRYTPNGIKTSDCASDCLNIPLERLDQRIQNRIGVILRKIGMVPHYRRIGKDNHRRWFWPSDLSNEPMTEE
jgi:predicted P-loop ATPase